MLYKQAWEELKDYLEKIVPGTREEENLCGSIDREIHRLEKRWEIVPPKPGRGG